MNKFVTLEANSYCVTEIEYTCKKCHKMFIEHIPSNYELVQFECSDKKKRYLPVYGTNGYLDLFNKLINDWNYDKSITVKDSKIFERKLSKICPYEVWFHSKANIVCPYCNSNEISVIQEKIISNFPVDWIEIKVDKE